MPTTPEPSQAPTTAAPSPGPTPRPTLVPTTAVPSPGPTTAAPTPDPADFRLEILTDQFPGETTWTLERVDGDESLCEVPADAQAGGPYSGQSSTHVKDASLCRGGTFRWSITDSYGDGICCSYGQGAARLYIDDVLIYETGAFGSSDSFEFSTPVLTQAPTLAPTTPTTPAPTPRPTQPQPTSDLCTSHAEYPFSGACFRYDNFDDNTLKIMGPQSGNWNTESECDEMGEKARWTTHWCPQLELSCELYGAPGKCLVHDQRDGSLRPKEGGGWKNEAKCEKKGRKARFETVWCPDDRRRRLRGSA